MIVLHHLERSRSHRILWLLEELGLPYRLERHARDPRTMLAPPALRQVHPLGKSPVITDGDVTVAESGAIVEYLLDAYGAGRLRPAAGTPARRACTYWLHFAEGSAMPPLLLDLVLTRLSGRAAPWFARPVLRAAAARVDGLIVAPNLRRHAEHVEATLAADAWFAGPEFSAADIQMSYPVEAMARRGVVGTGPATAGWLERIRARPAYVRAIEVGGPVMLR